jgi:hypothetical protein
LKELLIGIHTINHRITKMLRQKLVKNGTAGARGISSIVVAWLILGWSRPAFPDEQRHLRLAPIRFSTAVGGYIDYFFMRESYGGDFANQQTLSAEADIKLRASSFLWQPWLARVGGSVMLAVNDGISIGSNFPTNSSGNKSITGDADLNVLAYSRFPFNAHAYRMNNQTIGFLNDINSNFLTSGYNLDQIYRSRDGRLDTFTSYSHSTSGRVYFGTEDVNNQLNFTLSMEPARSHYTFRIVGLINEIEHPLTGSKGVVDSLVANHLYQPNDFLQVGTLFNIFNNSNTFVPVGTPSKQLDSFTRQFSSIGSWRSGTSPINVVGSVRTFDTDSKTDGVTNFKYSDTNFNIGADYSWSPLIKMYGSINVNDYNGNQTTITNAALTAQKGFGGREMTTHGGWRYSQTAGATLSNSTSTLTSGATNAPGTTYTSSVQSLGGNLGHELSKSTRLGEDLVTTILNQSLITEVNSVTSPSTRLNSNGTWAWNRMEGRTNSVLRFRVSDWRYMTGTRYFSQLMNLQGSRNQQMAHNQSLTGSLTLQGTRAGSSRIPTSAFILSPSANLNYRHGRLFNVKNLIFDSTLNIIGADIVASKGYDPGVSTQAHTNFDWENDLFYHIGRVTMELKSRIAEVNQITQYSISFHMNRTF